MIEFALFAGLMLAVALLFLLRTFAGKGRLTKVNRKELNITLFQQKKAELDKDLKEGSLEQEQYESSLIELEQQLLQDIPEEDPARPVRAERSKPAMIAVLISIPAAAIGLYAWLGSPQALNYQYAQTMPQNPHANGMPANGQQKTLSVAEMVGKLEQRMKQNPKDAKGWNMLARSYIYLREYKKAVGAYEKLVQLVPNHPQILSDYADVIGVTQGGSLKGKPHELLQKALTLDPNNLKALWLSGTYYYQQKEYKRAIQLWQRLQTMLKPNTEDARMVATILAQAQAKMTGKPVVRPAPGILDQKQTQQTTTAGASIQGHVSLDASLQNKVQPGDTVFIYARAAKGPRMPLAILRKQVKDLPLDFTLDDSMAMMPQMKLSNFQQVIVSARVSRSGNAITQSGDLIGSVPVDISKNSNKLNITINQVVK